MAICHAGPKYRAYETQMKMQRQGRAEIALLPKIAALELAYGIRSNVILCYADGERVSPFLHRG
jgi:hypothetical protein